ncbi:hypothetical protein LCGC14_1104830 [marine sediment metagenome]|uniref:Uncharacterized protein n=1 Tax=marine sediment metagenome TaxID=412755 RepID=A0A0F9MD46_9ZZZZ
MALTKDDQQAVAEHREEYGDKHGKVMAQEIEKGASISQAHKKALKGEIMATKEEIREGLAEIEHEQWIVWSKAVAPAVSPERRARWAKLWIPYSELTEEQKDQDRVWADKVLLFEDSQGVVMLEGRVQRYSVQTGQPIEATPYKILTSLIEEVPSV